MVRRYRRLLSIGLRLLEAEIGGNCNWATHSPCDGTMLLALAMPGKFSLKHLRSSQDVTPFFFSSFFLPRPIR
jgi:hypothetical protein